MTGKYGTRERRSAGRKAALRPAAALVSYPSRWPGGGRRPRSQSFRARTVQTSIRRRGQPERQPEDADVQDERRDDGPDLGRRPGDQVPEPASDSRQQRGRDLAEADDEDQADRQGQATRPVVGELLLHGHAERQHRPAALEPVGAVEQVVKQPHHSVSYRLPGRCHLVMSSAPDDSQEDS
ncbi:MAG TPA: hypothetical protein VEM58_11385 [Streptosporangiaceae bacterium]|nr:hypothetical protein [Streptosporangiaceae bacterium]